VSRALKFLKLLMTIEEIRHYWMISFLMLSKVWSKYKTPNWKCWLLWIWSSR